MQKTVIMFKDVLTVDILLWYDKCVGVAFGAAFFLYFLALFL